ncbi:META domain-containing protein [Leifsonia sp. NPDC058230]|uniref:META domain-containing protein n=1 Tax=Leifsonia sp. NPDC058230 TaxID=3346391 RepID=UPI0036DEBA0E
MKTVRIAAIVLALAASATLAGCSSSAPASSVAPTPTPSPSTAAPGTVGDFAGSWGTVQPGQPSLTIASDGDFNGTDGCNALAGTGKLDGDTYVFGPFASTLVACEGVTPWLNLAATATVADNTLTVFRTDGTQIGTLDKR